MEEEAEASAQAALNESSIRRSLEGGELRQIEEQEAIKRRYLAESEEIIEEVRVKVETGVLLFYP